MYADSNPAIVQWGYESISPIKYLDKSVNPPKVRRYYMDFVCKVRVGNSYKTVWIEVKSSAETKPPPKNAKPKTVAIWLKNSSKWEAARQMAKAKGVEFKIITEEQLS